MMKKLIILLFTVFLSVGSLSAQSTDVKKLEQQANQGDVEAQFNLGLTYYNGEGVPQDYAQAMKWYRLAADQGVAEAQYNLGLMYYNGRGVPQDDAQAMKWYRLAAEQGDAEAEYNLKRLPGKKMLFFFSNRWWRPFSLSEVPSLLIPLLLPFPLFFFKKTRKKLIELAAGTAVVAKIVTILAALNICYALAGWIGLIVTLAMMFLSLWGPVGSALALCVYHQQWAPASHLIAYSLFYSLLSFVVVILMDLLAKLLFKDEARDLVRDLTAEIEKLDKLKEEGLITAEDYEHSRKLLFDKVENIPTARAENLPLLWKRRNNNDF